MCMCDKGSGVGGQESGLIAGRQPGLPGPSGCRCRDGHTARDGPRSVCLHVSLQCHSGKNIWDSQSQHCLPNPLPGTQAAGQRPA